MYEANHQEYLVTLKRNDQTFAVAVDDEDLAHIVNRGEYEVLDEKELPARVDGAEVNV
jgi:hypothetical protein